MMTNNRNILLTAVCLLLLGLLAACAGAAEDEAEMAQEEPAEEVGEEVEATGSESGGKDLLPTPATGAKVSPTRVGGVVQLDVFLVVQPSISDSIELEVIPEWLEAQPIPVEPQFGFSFLSDAFTADVAFDPDFETATILLTQPPNETTLTQSPEDILSQILQLPGWRTDAERLLFLFITEESVALSEADLAIITDTAVSNSTTIYPFLVGTFSVENQLVWQEVAQATNGRLAQIPDADANNDESWREELSQSLDHALDN